MDKKLDHYLDWAFKALIALLIMLGVDAIRDMSKSVDELNVQIARVVVKQDTHERELGRIDVRLQRLERER